MEEKKINTSIKVIDQETTDQIDNKRKFNINGTWGLTNYFDTIVKNKELAKYRMQDPTSSSIFKNHSLEGFGSIENNNYSISRTKDTLATLTNNISGDDWHLIYRDSILTLVQNAKSKYIDTTTYIYRKRDDLKYFSKVNKDYYIIGNNVTEYFNKELFSGNYTNKKSQAKVIFNENGYLIGINGFDSYKVRNYFGTLHMYKNLDVISFINTKENNYKDYNWKFINNELHLTEFIRENVNYKGKIQKGEFMILGREKIELIKNSI